MPSARETEYGRDSKYGLVVGSFGAAEYTPTTRCPKKEVLARTYRLAWSHGCPNPTLCIENYGVDYMLDRYRECNRTLSFTLGLLEAFAPGLAYQFRRPVKRLPPEPAGRHEAVAVPKSHIDQIAMGAGLHGYALPRALILGEKSYLKRKGEKDKTPKSFEVIYDTVLTNSAEAKNIDELLAGTAHDLSLDTGLERAVLLSHLFPQGILDEENCHTTYDRFAKVLIQKAPELVRFYTELTPSQKAELEIATIPALK